MSIELGTAVLVGAIFFLISIGLPLAFATGLVAVIFAVTNFGLFSIPVVTSRVYSFINEYALVAIPMFVLMASLMDRSGIAKDLYNAMRVWAGGIRGGVAVQTLFAALLLAAMTGIIGGEIVLLGMIAMPQMLRLGYGKPIAIGTVVAGGSLGTMIPPSVVLIIYGLTANAPIGDLFLATVTPGFMLATLYAIYILARCYIDPKMGPPPPPEDRNIPLGDKLKLLKGLILPIAVAAWVLGSIYAGIASVTEAACMGVVGVFLSALVRGEVNLKMMWGSLYQTMNTCGMIVWLAIGANALVGVYNLMGGTRFIQSTITGLPVEPIVIIMIMMGILLILGLFMDWIGICFLTMPIFVPIVKSLGFDPVWFGILFCMNMQVSYISPPFGPACFYLKSVAPPDMTLKDIFSSVWPFIILQLIALALVLFIPDIAMWLPKYVFGAGAGQ